MRQERFLKTMKNKTFGFLVKKLKPKSDTKYGSKKSVKISYSTQKLQLGKSG